MNTRAKAFTVVELAIVIAVIAILATITIVAYNGAQTRAATSAITNFLNSTSKQLAVSYVNNGRYPDTLASTPDGPITVPNGMVVSYTPNNTASPPTYSLTASMKGVSYVSSDSKDPSPIATTQFTEEFFNNQTLTGTPVTNQVTSAFYDWGAAGPAGVGIDNFSGRWSATVSVPTAGNYTFYVTSDDGQRLYIDNSLVVDDWIAHGPTTLQYTTSFTANQMVSIRYEFFEIAGGAVAKLEWTPPSGTRAPVPAP